MNRLLLLTTTLVLAVTAVAQEPYEGETLFSAINSPITYLIELDGTVVQTWNGADNPASMPYLLDDGSILRPCFDPTGSFSGGGTGGRIQRIDADDTVVWDYYFSTSDYQQHHDIEPMPNGNVLVIAWELKTQAKAVAAGRQGITSDMWPTLIAEIEPVGATGGDIVWEWHAWDHLIQDADPTKDNYGVVADHPELIDVNYANVGGPNGGDWIHANAIDYNPELDQIVFSSRSFDELFVIDHSTTTAEAAGHTGGNSGMGGDILYRWGNPQVYDRGDSDDRYFYVIHGVNWIDEGLPGAGNILAFNNGDRPGLSNDYSTVAEIVPPVDEYGNYSISAGQPFEPAAPVWEYGDPGEFYGSPTQCGAFRFPNGNTLVCVSTSGYLFEVTESGDTVWEYDHVGGNIARAMRYWEDTGLDADDAVTAMHLTAGPNPLSSFTRLRFTMPEDGQVSLRIVDVAGREVAVLLDQHLDAGDHLVDWRGCDTSGVKVASGVYFAQIETNGGSVAKKLVLVR